MRFFVICGLLTSTLMASAQKQDTTALVTLAFVNNSDSVYQLALLAYLPNSTENKTFVSQMAPRSKKTYTFPAGTQLYLANAEQVSFNMSGNNIQKRGDKPTLVVRNEDKGRTIKLLQ
jgi:hypothetical protein